MLLCDGDISNGLDARSVRDDRYDQCEELYFSRPPARPYEAYDGAADAHLPIVQPKLDALGSLAVGTITSADPICRAAPYGKARNPDMLKLLERKEEIVWSFLKDAHLVARLEQIGPISGYTNAAHLFLDWNGIKGFKLDPKRPKEVVVWPASNIDCPQDARSVWRKAWMMKWQVEEKQEKEGWLSDGVLVATGNPSIDDTNRMSVISQEQRGKLNTSNASYNISNQRVPHNATNQDDQFVQIYQGTFMAPGKDGKQSLFWGVMDYVAKTILYVEPLSEKHGYDRHGAFKFAFKEETGFGYWSRSSVADNLQEIQLYANELLSLAIDGLRFSIFGTVFASSYSGTSADTRTSPGQIVLGMVVEPQGTMLPRPDLNWLLPILQWLAQWADIVSHVTTEASGGQAKSHTTAASVDARQAGLAASVSSYIGCFGSAIPDMFSYAEQLLVGHFEEAMLTPCGAMLGLTEDDKEALLLPCCWKLVASSPQWTPASQAQIVQQMLGPIKQMLPGAMVDDYNVANTMFSQLSRTSGVDTSGFQTPRTVEALIPNLAQMIGVDPSVVAQAIEVLQQGSNERQQAAMGQGLQPGDGNPPNGPEGMQQPDSLGLFAS